MLTNVDKNVAKNLTRFECKKCDYITCKKHDYEKHLKTKKHLHLQNVDKNSPELSTALMMCVCGKIFKHRQSLCVHKKKCGIQTKEQPINITDTELVKFLLKENQEFKQLIIEQSSKMLEQSNKMLELANKPYTINNNNCNNKQFNLNLFLNEKCKNAMNMSDFVNSLQIMDEDFEDIGKLGYIQGISNIFIKGLQDLDETARPLHCSDIKRETLYIKDNDVWNKDENKQKIIEAINGVSHKNVKYIPIWRDAHPDALDGTSKKNTQYMRIVNQVMSSVVPDDPNGINKIIRNVANKVCIDKE
jgi:hypothetical protein